MAFAVDDIARAAILAASNGSRGCCLSTIVDGTTVVVVEGAVVVVVADDVNTPPIPVRFKSKATIEMGALIGKCVRDMK
jgi:Iap family predicted aminopeptidase